MLNARMIISKALREQVQVITFFYSGLFTNFRYLGKMVLLENIDPVIREESKKIFLNCTQPIIY